eukprot:symbB.v1.2.020013.t1/scaffold1662.1/size108665/1
MLEEHAAGHETKLHEALKEQQAQHHSNLDLALQIVQDKDHHHAKKLQDHQEQHQSEMERALQAPGLAESLCAVSNHQYTSHRHKDYSIKVRRMRSSKIIFDPWR